jgi:hypothetical protein
MYQPTTECKGLPWKVGRYLPVQEILCFYRIWRFTTVLTRACNYNNVKNNYNTFVLGFLQALTTCCQWEALSSEVLCCVTKLISSAHSVTCAPLCVVIMCHRSFLSSCQGASPFPMSSQHRLPWFLPMFSKQLVQHERGFSLTGDFVLSRRAQFCL